MYVITFMIALNTRPDDEYIWIISRRIVTNIPPVPAPFPLDFALDSGYSWNRLVERPQCNTTYKTRVMQNILELPKKQKHRFYYKTYPGRSGYTIAIHVGCRVIPALLRSFWTARIDGDHSVHVTSTFQCRFSYCLYAPLLGFIFSLVAILLARILHMLITLLLLWSFRLDVWLSTFVAFLFVVCIFWLPIFSCNTVSFCWFRFAIFDHKTPVCISTVYCLQITWSESLFPVPQRPHMRMCFLMYLSVTCLCRNFVPF